MVCAGYIKRRTVRGLDGAEGGGVNVLIGCESSGTVREAFRRLGHDAWSCDLLPAVDGSAFHMQGDVREALRARRWDIFIVHPTCTYLCSSGLHWNRRGRMVDGRPRQELTEEALGFVREMMAAPVDRIALENPTGCIGTRIRKADQYVQPYEFGDDASKKTGLWLKGLPKLDADPAKRTPGRWVTHNGKLVERWANQTDSGQNRLGPSDDRWQARSVTYSGIANAMAAQWGGLFEQARSAA